MTTVEGTILPLHMETASVVADPASREHLLPKIIFLLIALMIVGCIVGTITLTAIATTALTRIEAQNNRALNLQEASSSQIHGKLDEQYRITNNRIDALGDVIGQLADLTVSAANSQLDGLNHMQDILFLLINAMQNATLRVRSLRHIGDAVVASNATMLALFRRNATSRR